MLNTSAQVDLQALREAAQQRDHEQAQFWLKKIFSGMPYFVALAVVLESLHAYLDIFESYYPEESWVRQLLVSVASFGQAPEDQIAELALSQAFSAPGAGNYIKAVYDLTQCMQAKHTGEARVGYMTSAVVNALMAELVEAYYGERPDEWTTQRQAGDSDAARVIAYAFWTDATTATLDVGLWLSLAENLEAKLRRSGQIGGQNGGQNASGQNASGQIK